MRTKEQIIKDIKEVKFSIEPFTKEKRLVLLHLKRLNVDIKQRQNALNRLTDELAILRGD